MLASTLSRAMGFLGGCGGSTLELVDRGKFSCKVGHFFQYPQARARQSTERDAMFAITLPRAIFFLFFLGGVLWS